MGGGATAASDAGSPAAGDDWFPGRRTPVSLTTASSVGVGGAAAAVTSPSSTPNGSGRSSGGGRRGGRGGGGGGGVSGDGGDGRIPWGPTNPHLGVIMGTTFYQAPEVTAAAPAGDYGSPPADVWALGVVALKLLARELRPATAGARSVGEALAAQRSVAAASGAAKGVVGEGGGGGAPQVADLSVIAVVAALPPAVGILLRALLQPVVERRLVV